jgi:hypothetical protein
MRLEEKDTSSGSDLRTYRCDQCRQSHDVDRGPALWKILSDARDADERSPGVSLIANGEVTHTALPRREATMVPAMTRLREAMKRTTILKYGLLAVLIAGFVFEEGLFLIDFFTDHAFVGPGMAKVMFSILAVGLFLLARGGYRLWLRRHVRVASERGVCSRRSG